MIESGALIVEESWFPWPSAMEQGFRGQGASSSRGDWLRPCPSLQMAGDSDDGYGTPGIHDVL